VTLVEVLPELVERARSAATQVEADVQVVAADAGCSQTYVGLVTVPADVVLLVGVLGNISDADVAATVAAMPCLCASGDTLLWSRGRPRKTLGGITPAQALQRLLFDPETPPMFRVIRAEAVDMLLMDGWSR
jgi:hypothetical protein